ncbi:MAG: hypothetical protein WC091_04350 [Sulfuricellaceae bacterium]
MLNTEKETVQTPTPIEPLLSARDLTEVLIKHYGIHEGFHDLMIAYQIGMGGVGPNDASISPGVMIGISKIGLTLSSRHGPNSVDAAIVNPVKKPRKLRPKESLSSE